MHSARVLPYSNLFLKVSSPFLCHTQNASDRSEKLKRNFGAAVVAASIAKKTFGHR
jgi:hypothetical protein